MKIKKIDLGDIAQIIAMLGVIIGMILVAYELDQNNQYLESQASLNLMSNRADVHEFIAGNRELSEALLAGIKGEPLTELQQFRLERIYVLMFTKWDWEYQQYTQGRVGENQLPINDWVFIVETFPGMLDLWSIEKELGRTPGFVEFMDENVVDQ